MPRRSSAAEVERRRQEALRLVTEEGEIRIDMLAAMLGISLMTAHRDLDDLQARNLLQKKRGTAAAFTPVEREADLRLREHDNLDFKRAAAGPLQEVVSPGDTVLLDCGSTLFPFAAALGSVPRLRVVTTSLRVSYLLSESSVDVTLLGERFFPEFESCAGPEVLRQLDRFRIDVAFLTATCVQDGGLSHPVRDYAENKEGFLKVAARTVLAVDHTKFGRTATYAYGRISDYDLLVTDAAAPADELRRARSARVQVRELVVD